MPAQMKCYHTRSLRVVTVKGLWEGVELTCGSVLEGPAMGRSDGVIVVVSGRSTVLVLSLFQEQLE